MVALTKMARTSRTEPFSILVKMSSFSKPALLLGQIRCRSPRRAPSIRRREGVLIFICKFQYLRTSAAKDANRLPNRSVREDVCESNLFYRRSRRKGINVKNLIPALLALFSLFPASAQTTALGIDAAASTTNSLYVTAIGIWTLRNAADSFSAIATGNAAGHRLNNAPYAAIYGNHAAEELSNAPHATIIGPSAARFARDAEGLVCIGLSCGYQANEIRYGVWGGYAAARFTNSNTYSVGLGYAVGEYSDRSHASVMAGLFAGYKANDSMNLVSIGRFAGGWANNSPDSVMIGPFAGGAEKHDGEDHIQSANHVVRGIYIGLQAGKDSSNTTDVILIGSNTRSNPDVRNAIGLGRDANVTLSNSMNVPVLKKAGGGVLVVNDVGDVTASDQLKDALAAIASLKARVDALEARQGK